jgi:hypothetical protein
LRFAIYDLRFAIFDFGFMSGGRVVLSESKTCIETRGV